MHRLSAVAHKSSTSLCTASRVTNPPAVPAGRQQPASAPGAGGDTAAGRARGSGPGARFRAGREVPGRTRMRSGQNPGRRCSPPSWPGRPRRRLPSPTAPDRGTAAWGLAWTPGRDLGHRGWQAGGCRRTGPGTRRSGRAESDKAPMYEMGALPSLAAPGPASCLACWRRAPPAGARHPCEGPGSPAPPTFPGSPPRWCPFPTVKAFLLPPRTPRKSLKSIISGLSAIHTVSTERMELSAPYGGYPPANPHDVHKSPYVTPETPGSRRRRM